MPRSLGLVLLLLVRHGLTDLTETRLIGRLPGVSLNEKGRAQAGAAADLVAPLPLAAIFCSPMERTQQTAAPLAESKGLSVEQLEGLLEVDYGEWAGQEFKVLRKTELWKVVQQHPSGARFPGGESVREAQARIVGTIEGILARHPKDVVAAFSHSDMIKLAVAHFTGVHLDLYQRLVVSAGSVTALHLGSGPPALVKLNEVGSLADLQPPPSRRGKN
ncbi:MAG TPA: MSMEG_4193 family putative phosphomutase [Candidatus Dormibacteraeota bacterium]|nr:MSMEG_4193 family putative phosphomutase [Candidatus Dormibacteraeota bacterium]